MRSLIRVVCRVDDIYLEDLIAPNYDELLNDVLDHKYTRYVLKGGRGSLKSSFCGFCIPLLMIYPGNENMHAVCYRKTASTLRDSVFNQILSAIEMLGLSDEFTSTVSPMKITRKETGQTIVFRGVDDKSKLKSLKAPFGYFAISWFEECDAFSGMAEIRNIMQSSMRGGSKFWCFMSFNPPETRANFMNEYVLQPRTGQIVHHSTYETVPVDWLGEQFFDDAQQLKELNPKAYAHEYLGEVTGTGGEVFENVRLEEISDEQISHFDQIYMGIDWGWYPDPFHWSKMHYDAARRILYIFDEYRCNKKGNAETWEALQNEKGVTGGDLITADSAEPKSVGDYRSYGALCREAVKGPDSVRYGVKWLQSLVAIVIDPVRCPATAEEFSKYEYEKTPEGDVISGYPDRDNHSIDSVRYALERVWRRKGR